MIPFTNPAISIANASDADAITQLLNSAYRGESSKQGWTTEAHLIEGDVRTDAAGVLSVIQQPGSVMLVCRNQDEQIIGCVNLQQHEEKIYLGMLSVAPQLQGAGTGKQLLKAADELAVHLKCTAVYMTVISEREELINWYKRHGYTDTGIRKPFNEDGLTGKHRKQLEFMVLEKKLS